MKPLFLIFITSILLGASCSSDKSSFDEPTVIFGHFFGECSGERCLETYMLQGDALFEDLNDSFDRSFDFSPLSAELYNQVNDLRTLIPDELNAIEGQTFGCPDCGDQGGVFLRLVDQGSKEFFIDQDTNGLPEYLQTFVRQVNDRIALLP
jgi:hypothetical protein